jgi:mannose-6-phosphate isomerase
MIMVVKRLSTIRVEKPWGRHSLWPGFQNPAACDPPIGEIWFSDDDPERAPLMVKYLFTSERLSIQVHPDDDYARAAGHPTGKEECWYVLDADVDARIGLGLTLAVDAQALRCAALDGSIETLLDWKPVSAGDVIYVPAGTIHAIGAGVTVVEIQQNLDLTYRLYDYGRPRALQIDDSIAVAKRDGFDLSPAPSRAVPGVTVIAQGGKFVVEYWAGLLDAEIDAGLFVPLSGSGSIAGASWTAGQCWRVLDRTEIRIDEGSVGLFAYPGAHPRIM